jgi:hypothetical protein
VLQWWDPAAKATLSDRVNGDLVAAISRAREIDNRLTHFRSAGPEGTRKLSHSDLVLAFQKDLVSRANAGEIDARTVDRYRAALAHYLAFCCCSEVQKKFSGATGVNRDFRLGLCAFLANRNVTPNGRSVSTSRPMRGSGFVLDTVRAMFEWAANPDRGHLLPDGFRNPFLRCGGKRNVLKGDPLSAPDITLDMAIQLIHACDHFQLRLFGTILLFGLRASEPCFLFVEDLKDRWLAVPNRPELDLRTKGRRDKRFPFPKAIEPIWRLLDDHRAKGLLFRRRTVEQGQETPTYEPMGAEAMSEQFRKLLAKEKNVTAIMRRRTRDKLFHGAGAITYDLIEGEFHRLSRQLSWPAEATVKDLRHLFATSMTNAGMPDVYLRYLMGHAPERAAVMAYTHLHELERHYSQALEREWGLLIGAIAERAKKLEAA